MHEVFRLSGGNPRLINILCDQALLSGYALDKKKIGPELIRESIENTAIPLNTQKETAAEAKDLKSAGQPTPTEANAENIAYPLRAATEKPSSRGLGRKTAYGAMAALIVVMALAGYFYLNDKFRAAPTGSQSYQGQTQSSVHPAEPTPGAGEIARLQDEMLELRRQKDDAERRLRELQTRFAAFEKDQQELKAAKARVAELENAMALKDKDLLATDQRSKELENALAQEKSAKDRLVGEFSSKEAAIAELQERLKIAGSEQAQLKGELDTVKKDSTRLQAQLVENKIQKDAVEAQLQEARAQKPVPPPAPAPARVLPTSQPPLVASDTADAAPDPAGVIDFVLKKKSQ